VSDAEWYLDWSQEVFLAHTGLSESCSSLVVYQAQQAYNYIQEHGMALLSTEVCHFYFYFNACSIYLQTHTESKYFPHAGAGYTGAEEPMNLLRDVIDADEISLDRWTSGYIYVVELINR
jgi:hypothetical protein